MTYILAHSDVLLVLLYVEPSPMLYIPPACSFSASIVFKPTNHTTVLYIFFLNIIAAGCCFLAAKVEESFRKPDDIANQFFVIHPNNEVSSIPVGASSTH